MAESTAGKFWLKNVPDQHVGSQKAAGYGRRSSEIGIKQSKHHGRNSSENGADIRHKVHKERERSPEERKVNAEQQKVDCDQGTGNETHDGLDD